MSGIDRLDLGRGFFDVDVAEDLRPSFGAPTFANDLASKPIDVDALQLEPTDFEILETDVTRDADTIHFKYVARQIVYSHPFIMVRVEVDARKPPRRHSVNDAANRLLAIDAKKGRVRYRTRRRALLRLHKRSDAMKPGSGSEALRKAAIRIRTRRPNRALRRARAQGQKHLHGESR